MLANNLFANGFPFGVLSRYNIEATSQDGSGLNSNKIID